MVGARFGQIKRAADAGYALSARAIRGSALRGRDIAIQHAFGDLAIVVAGNQRA